MFSISREADSPRHRRSTLRTASSATAGILALAIVILVLTPASPADATFPGRNGDIIAGGTQNSIRGAIFEVAADDGSQDVLVRPGVKPSVSPDGRYVLYTQEVEISAGIRSIDRRTGKVTSLGSRGSYDTLGSRGSYDKGLDFEPQFLGPNGDSIIFSSTKDPRGRRARKSTAIWRMRADGTHARPVSEVDPPGTVDFSPISSPDGKQIAFLRRVRHKSPRPQLYLMGSDGTNVRRLTFKTGRKTLREPDFSPDGSRIVFRFGSHGDPARGLATVSVRGGPIDVIAKGGGFYSGYYYPSYSPDGKRILYSTFAPAGGIQLATVDTNGDDLTYLTDSAIQFNQGTDWAPLKRR